MIDRSLQDVSEDEIPGDPLRERVDRTLIQAGMPTIGVSVKMGRLLTWIVQQTRPRHIVEIGTLGGYSAMCLARGNPTTQIETIELQASFVAVARSNIDQEGYARQIQVVHSDAAVHLVSLREQHRMFDLAFIDADKRSYPHYLDAVVPMMVVGGLILADNVFAKGRLYRTAYRSSSVDALRTFHEQLRVHPRLRAQIVHCDDGLAIAQVVR